jgi:hypothetical protein
MAILPSRRLSARTVLSIAANLRSAWLGSWPA